MTVWLRCRSHYLPDHSMKASGHVGADFLANPLSLSLSLSLGWIACRKVKAVLFKEPAKLGSAHSLSGNGPDMSPPPQREGSFTPVGSLSDAFQPEQRITIHLISLKSWSSKCVKMLDWWGLPLLNFASLPKYQIMKRQSAKRIDLDKAIPVA